MKRLIVIALVLSLCVGVAAWQQQSLAHLRAEIAKLSEEILRSRAALDAYEGRLAELRKEARRMQEVRAAQDVEVVEEVKVGPKEEGWWPVSKEYFYMDKRMLPFVRLRDREMSLGEVAAKWGKAEPDTVYEVENRLISGAGLNEHMATLLGMSVAEKAAVEKLYIRLLTDVKDIEVAKIERLDPPKPNGKNGKIIARIPPLTADTRPVIERTKVEMERLLGMNRTELLGLQSLHYLNQYQDGLGSDLVERGEITREFVLMPNHNITVSYVQTIGKKESRWFKGTTYYAPPNRTDPWEYGHLFGKGGPLEMK